MVPFGFIDAESHSRAVLKADVALLFWSSAIAWQTDPYAFLRCSELHMHTKPSL